MQRHQATAQVTLGKKNSFPDQQIANQPQDHREQMAGHDDVVLDARAINSILATLGLTDHDALAEVDWDTVASILGEDLDARTSGLPKVLFMDAWPLASQDAGRALDTDLGESARISVQLPKAPTLRHVLAALQQLYAAHRRYSPGRHFALEGLTPSGQVQYAT